ncbi:MAG: ABC transporter permease subunit, partial [Bacteroidota bacterium]
SSSLQESAYLLGASHRSYFRTIALPLASPAVIGGLFLVIMEVLNDYGAAKYYGVQTFTTGIFRTWNFLNDLQSAIYLAVILVALVLVLGWLERLRRGRRSYALTGRREQGREQRRALPKGGKRLLCLFVILLPILAGLVLPLAQLTYWALMTIGDQWSKALLWTSLQSFGLASTVAVLALICSFCLIYYSRWSRSRLTRVYPRLVSIGYVMPGAIIGIGIIGALQWLVDFFASGLDWKIGAYVYNSLFILLYAYLFRFLAVAYGPIEAENIRIGRQLAESSSLLGKKPLSTLFNIDIPLLTQSALSAFALVFIDAMKELPLTLLLKPYDVQTLSMTAYQYADDELVQQAGLPALLLISVVGLLLALLKNRLLSRE